MDRETERRLGEIVKIGVISEVQHEKGLCRVSFGERVSPLSKWFMCRCGKDKDYWHPDIGEEAAFISPFGDGSHGFVLVGISSDKMPLPEGAGENVRITEYADGTRLTIDREKHIVDLTDSYGSSIRMEGGYIYLKPAIQVKVQRGGKGKR